MPMAGRGQRFADQGYKIPKQLIEVKGKKVIEWAIQSLPYYANFIFVVHADQNKHFGLSDVLKKIVPLCTIVETDTYTEGPACTALLAKNLISIDYKLIVADSDFHTIWDYDAFLDRMSREKLDACAVCEYSSAPKNSYVVLNEEGYICRAAEKEVISNISPHGIHYYRKGKQFVECAESMIKKGTRYNNEFYITPIYNEFYERGMKCGVHFSSRHFPLGIPQDLETFAHVQL